MLESINLQKILFLDIETVPQFPSYQDMPKHFKELWDKKCATFHKEDKMPYELYPRAGIYAEFGKIICICCAAFQSDGALKMHSFYGDEKKLLNDFADLLHQSFSSSDKMLCAHNGKEFDFPFISRRLVIHGIKLPQLLDTPGKKPWEVNHLDTMELWKFGDYKSYTSLSLLAAVFDIPTPKDDIDGSMVGKVYWEEKNLERIVRYCRKDVLTIARIFKKFRGEEFLSEKSCEEDYDLLVQ